MKHTFPFLILVVLMAIPGCRKERDVLPETLDSDTEITKVFDVSASARSLVAASLPGNLIQYGHVWRVEGGLEPTVSDQRTQLFGKSTTLPPAFTSTLTGLTKQTTYRVRSYVQTSAGTVYGRSATFSTASDYIGRLTKILEDSLKDSGFGYSFAISKKGVLVGSGVGGFQSRRVEYSGEHLLSMDSRMQIASMTKTITAIAFLKLAKQKGINTTSKVVDYLPAGWVRGKGFERVTFADLMTHKSGIVGLGEYCANGSFSENHWYGLKSIVAKGVRGDQYGNQCYQNANFGLFRVIIPMLLGYQFTGNDIEDDEATQQIYEKYITEEILQKAGVSMVPDGFLNNWADSPTFGYDFPYSPNGFGFNPLSFTSTAGAYGIYLSANQASKFYSSVFGTTDESVLSQSLKDTLLNKGFANFSALTPQGKFSYHDGWWYSSYGGGKYLGFRSTWMVGPDDLVVVLFTNALRNGDGLFPIRSDYYYDITSYVLWAFSELDNPNRNARREKVNFHTYLKNPEPH